MALTLLLLWCCVWLQRIFWSYSWLSDSLKVCYGWIFFTLQMPVNQQACQLEINSGERISLTTAVQSLHVDTASPLPLGWAWKSSLRDSASHHDRLCYQICSLCVTCVHTYVVEGNKRTSVGCLRKWLVQEMVLSSNGRHGPIMFRRLDHIFCYYLWLTSKLTSLKKTLSR